jgi:Domain of unknown function (DUF4926)
MKLPNADRAEVDLRKLSEYCLPALGLTAGELGAVVEVLGDGDAFEVEFCDNSGQTYGLHTLCASQIIGLHHRGQALRLPVDVA